MHRIVAISVVLCAWAASSAAAADFECVIQPRQILEIRSPIEGLLERITVDRGDSVRKGQALAFIDTSVERVLAEGAKYRAEMDGALLASTAKLRLTLGKLDRAEDLLDQKFLSQQARDDTRFENRLAVAELKEAQDNRKLAEIEYRRQLALIELKTVRSPINGVVMERILNVGEVVEAGVGRRPILKLAEIETLHVETLIPAEAYRQIKIGMVGEVAPATAEGTTQRATVSVIDRVLDPGSGTFGVRLTLPNKGGQLLAGVRCRVRFAELTLSGTASRGGEPVRGVVPRAPSPSTAK